MANKVCSPKIAPAAWLKAGKFDQLVGFRSVPPRCGEVDHRLGLLVHQNESHWDTGNYPYKNLAVKVITSDTAAVSALKTNQIDAILVEQPSVNEVKASGMESSASRARPRD